MLNIKYTPYRLGKKASGLEREAHKAERAFYDMTGGENVYKYITTEGKVTGKKAGKITALEYLQKSTGVFNGDGMISEEKVAEMKERLKNNKGNIWHGFVSLNKEQSYKIGTPEKCIGMIKATFGQFFNELNPSMWIRGTLIDSSNILANMLALQNEPLDRATFIALFDNILKKF